jgi:predicted MFS family arabinose efflux permease
VPPIVLLLSLAGFAAVAVMRMVDPLLPVLAAEFSVTLGQAGLIIAAYSLSYGACVLVYGPLGDRYGKLRVILLCSGMSAFCIFMGGFARDLHTLILWRFLTGVTCAATVPLSLAFIGDAIDLEHRQRALARYMSGVIMGQIAGGGLGGIVADLAGWRALFWVYGVLTLAITGAVWLRARRLALPGEPNAGLRGSFDQYRAILARRTGREVMGAVFIEGLFLFGGTAYLGALLHDRYALGLTPVGLLLMCVGLGSLLYTGAVGWLIRHLGQRRMIALGAALMMASFLALTRLTHWLPAGLLLALLGFAIYLMHNTLQTLATELAPAARGTAVSLMAFVLFAGQASGAWLLGQGIDRYGYVACLTVNALALGLLGAWLQGTRALRRAGG